MMEVVQNNIDDLNAELCIKIKPEDYKESVESGLKQFRKNVNMPGFRPGQAPMAIVKKKYGKSVLADELNKLVSKGLQDHIEGNKLNVLGNPLPKEDAETGDWDNPSNFEFVYEIGLAPEIKVSVDKKGKFDYYLVKIEDDMINGEVENIRRRYGKLVPVEKAEEQDMLLGQFQELDENGKPKADGIMHSSTVNIQFLEDEKVKKSLTGKKVGDTFKLDPDSVSKGDSDKAAMLGVKVEELADINSEFNFTVTEIKRMEMADLDQEFYDKVFGEGNVKSEDEMRAKIAEEIQNVYKRDSDYLLRKDIQDKLIEKAKIDLPEEFLKKWIMASNEKPITKEQLENDFPEYSKGLRWQLIENHLVKDNDIKVEHEEVINYTKGVIAQNFGRYGMPVPEDKELTEMAENSLKNQDEIRQIYQNLFDTKLMGLFKEKFAIKEKEISLDDMKAKFEN